MMQLLKVCMLVCLSFLASTALSERRWHEDLGHHSQDDHEQQYEEAYSNCPNPQAADQVKQVYVAHATFVWADLAKRTAGNSSKAREAHRPSAEKPNKRPFVDPTRRTHPKPTASNDTQVKTAAVTDPDFLLTTSMTQTGVGFHGTSFKFSPPDEALAVAEHPSDPGTVIILNGVNSAFEIFAADRDGRQIPSHVPTKVETFDILSLLNITKLDDTDPTAWFDPKERHWVLLFTTFGLEGVQIQPPLVIAVSHSDNPLGKWTVWALDAGVNIAPGLPFCAGQPYSDFVADYPQTSFSDHGIFVSVTAFCGFTGISTLFAYSKAALYALPPSDSGTSIEIYAAVYFGPTAWYRSLPVAEQFKGSGTYTPFNNFIMPSRPQQPADMSTPPLFVMKVNNEYMSIATLTSDAALAGMTSVRTAPKIMARVMNKGADFSNTPGLFEGIFFMYQPNTDVVLDAGDVGMLERSSAVRSYGTMHHKGVLYLTTSEYFGVGDVDNRLPSAYWAIVQPDLPGLCDLSRKDWGVIASSEGLAISYPVIAALQSGSGAVLAYSYGGAGTVSGGRFPAYAGVATSVVTCDDHNAPSMPLLIDIVQRGPGALPNVTKTSNVTTTFQRWGDYSAAQVLDDKMWFAVPIPIPDDKIGFWMGTWVGVVSLE